MYKNLLQISKMKQVAVLPLIFNKKKNPIGTMKIQNSLSGRLSFS
jgi:hypothetical protein